MGIPEFIHKVRTRENRFYSWLHDCYRNSGGSKSSVPKWVGGLFLSERTFRKHVFYLLKNRYYFEPMLRYRCTSVGVGVKTDGDIPLISGNGRIIIGDRVRLGNRLAFFVSQRFQNLPELSIGDDSSINFFTEISVCDRVSIGKRCRIAGDVKIFDNNSHSIYFENERRMTEADVKPIVIEDDVWVGMRSIILKGVTLGKGCVVAAGSVVTKDVAEMTVVGGNPARTIKKISVDDGRDQV